MLCKAARRKQAIQFWQQTSEQIHLPWLCPVLYVSPTNTTQSRLISHRPSARLSSANVLPSHSSRRLASATASPEILRSDGYLHYKSQRDPQSTSNLSPRRTLSDVSPHNPDQLILLDTTVADPPERVLSNKFKEIQIRGDAQEVMATMHACLQVDLFDRAISLLRQLQLILQPNSTSLRDAFNDCLQGMIMNMIVGKDNRNVPLINQWVEVNMHNAGVEPDARTYALKVKFALATMTGPKRDRTVRRYWELARQDQRLNEVASLRDILSEQDLGKLSEIVPQIELEPEPEDYHPSDNFVKIVDQPVLAHRPVEEVLETEQKGLGLGSLRQSLSLFKDLSLLGNEPREAAPGQVEARQSQLETDSVRAAVDRWRIEHDEMVKKGVRGNLQSGTIGALLWQWHKVLAEKLRADLKMVEAAETKVHKDERDKLRCEYGPFLRLLDTDHLAALVTITTISMMDRHGLRAPIRLSRIVTGIGQMMEAEIGAEQDRVSSTTSPKNTNSRKARMADRSPEATIARALPRPKSPNKQIRNLLRSYRGRYDWTPAIHARIGAALCEMLFDSAKITKSEIDSVTGKRLHVSVPVFSRNIQYKSGRKIGYVEMHPTLVEKLMKEPPGALIAKHLPMVCEPKPWTEFRNGGFLETQTNFVRIRSGELSQRDYAVAAAERGDLDQVFAGVDVLGKTGWKINYNVFQVMLKAWNSGEGVANLPPLNKVFEMPEKPTDPNDRAALARWYFIMRKIENEKSGLHSHRCFQNFQMEIARAYLNETFYLPHNIDFRGRAYPIPPYLNQMGADNCRGLLVFANGRELGEEGLRWIKIHLSNVFGYDKANFKDRENFPMEHLSDIIDSVERPLDGRRWWLEAGSPWQCLAACFELKNALDLPDPTKYISRLPVHQDGSCNGLQHYAALGGDIAGAKQVNLEPGDKPSDVYTGVAELIKAEIKQESAEGNEIAARLDGRITRKIVKQTVMTNVYGVTYLGAIRQVRRQLDDLLPDLREHTQARSIEAAVYVARKIFNALGAMFTGAHDIQYWLGDCATRISTSLSPAQLQKVLDAEDNVNDDGSGSRPGGRGHKTAKQSEKLAQIAAFRSSVIWTTPLRLPVVQPYRVSNGRRIRTNLQDITLTEPTIADAVDKRKQLQAFPPNFIHSLDATHMFLSALKCHEVGLTFSAVHDSFWTHAADINTLNRLLRDAFIRMHSEDIVGRLAVEFNTRYKDHLYLASIDANTPLGKQIKFLRTKLHEGKLAAKFSADRQYTELVLEARRQRLLKSSDPVEREQGEKIESPCSLFDKMDGHRYLSTRNSLGETAIGAIPQQTDKETLEQALQSGDANNDVDMDRALQPLVEGHAVPHDTVDFDEPAFDQNSTNEDAESQTSQASTTTSSPSSASTGSVEAVATESNTATSKKRKSKGQSSGRAIWLWIPLAFKAVPQKGDFDVTRLRNSQYFFS